MDGTHAGFPGIGSVPLKRNRPWPKASARAPGMHEKDIAMPSPLRRTRALLARLGRSTHGATALEYGLLGALIAVAVMGTVNTIGRSLDLTFTHLMLAVRYGAA